MLARVTSCLRAGSPVEVTVLDRCQTPLELSRIHALDVGIEIETIRTDILEFESERSFDLICTHSFMTFFPAADRRRLVERWRALLRPGGCVVTARELALGYGENHQTHLIASARDIGQLFLDQGFVLEEFVPPAAERRLLDRSGAPANASSCRWRILARRP